jgi:hypothetical protein
MGARSQNSGARSGAWSSRNTREHLNTSRSALRNFGSALPPALLGRSRSERAPGLRSGGGGGGALPVTMVQTPIEEGTHLVRVFIARSPMLLMKLFHNEGNLGGSKP